MDQEGIPTFISSIIAAVIVGALVLAGILLVAFFMLAG